MAIIAAEDKQGLILANIIVYLLIHLQTY
jgi:hypothetical protein